MGCCWVLMTLKAYSRGRHLVVMMAVPISLCLVQAILKLDWKVADSGAADNDSTLDGTSVGFIDGFLKGLILVPRETMKVGLMTHHLVRKMTLQMAQCWVQVTVKDCLILCPLDLMKSRAGWHNTRLEGIGWLTRGTLARHIGYQR